MQYSRRQLKKMAKYNLAKIIELFQLEERVVIDYIVFSYELKVGTITLIEVVYATEICDAPYGVSVSILSKKEWEKVVPNKLGF